MFEAHIYSEITSTVVTKDIEAIDQQKTYLCWHSIYQCNVKYWGSAGKRQGQSLLFIFIEYRHKDNSHGFKRLELCADNYNRTQLNELISRLPLDDQLDPVKTETWCRSLKS